jgi:hypothetical protein
MERATDGSPYGCRFGVGGGPALEGRYAKVPQYAGSVRAVSDTAVLILAADYRRHRSELILAPSTSPWVTRIERGQPWADESRTQ